MIQRYTRKLSCRLLDRIELHIEGPAWSGINNRYPHIPGRTANAGAMRRYRPSARTAAAHCGHAARIVRSQWSSMARNLLGREYSTHPSCAASPKSPKRGIRSADFATKHR